MAKLDPTPEYISRNYALCLEQAVSDTQNSESIQQERDTKTAEMDVKYELGVYKLWNESLKKAADTVSGYSYDAARAEGGTYGGHDASYYREKAQAWQAKLSADNSLANAYENQADGPVQSAQSQVQGDASNNQKITQLVGTINTMETMISGMLQSALS